MEGETEGEREGVRLSLVPSPEPRSRLRTGEGWAKVRQSTGGAGPR